MSPKEFLETTGEFLWFWNDRFLIETSYGNYLWSDPDYNGDNTIKYTSKTYDEYLKGIDLPYGRSKGTHVIGDYCGRDVIFTKGTIGRLSSFSRKTGVPK